jgi:hypothetical protein
MTRNPLAPLQAVAASQILTRISCILNHPLAPLQAVAASQILTRITGSCNLNPLAPLQAVTVESQA